MENQGMDKQLFEFFDSYDLIQADIDENQAIDLLNNALKNLEEEENVLTGFISKINSDELSGDQAVLITDKNRIITSSDEKGQKESIDFDDITLVENPEDEGKIVLHTNSGTKEFIAKETSGANGLSDAIYSAFAQSMSDDKLKEIFSEDAIELESEENSPEVNNDLDVIDTSKSVPEVMQETEYEVISDSDATGSFNNDVFLSGQNFTEFEQPNLAAPQEETKKGKKVNLNKPVLYILIAIGVILLAVVIYSVYNYYSVHRVADENASELISVFNQSDNIYFTAQDYANSGNTNVQQWSDLENQAKDVESQLNDYEPNEVAEDLYQAVFFYNDSLLTALYYGRTYAQTQNAYQLTTLNQRLKTAENNRLEVLRIIDEDFPSMMDKVEHQTDLDDIEPNYPGYDENKAKEEQLNSQPSEGELNRENTESSNPARENALNSKESD